MDAISFMDMDDMDMDACIQGRSDLGIFSANPKINGMPKTLDYG
jgi:hypothetical protein